MCYSTECHAFFTDEREDKTEIDWRYITKSTDLRLRGTGQNCGTVTPYQPVSCGF